MIVVPKTPVLLAVIPSSVAPNRAGGVGPVPPMSNMIVYMSHPIPNTSVSSKGIPNDVYDDLYRIQSGSLPHVNEINASATMQRPS